jgi:rhodanese-related sulfurtransferase
MKQLTAWAAASGLLILGVAGCDRSMDAQGGLNRDSLARVAQSIARSEDHVAVKDLADLIIQETGDFILIDVRDAGAYQAGHIKTARSLPLTELLSAEAIDGLEAGRKLILYSEESANAAQAAAVLRLAGRDAYSLTGGYQQWLGYMTEPASASAGGDAHEQAKRQAVQCYFEGDYVAEAGLMVKAGEAGGFTPPLMPVESDAGAGDPLGLGLGLEAASGQTGTPAERGAVSEDPLGLGLGLEPASAPVSGAGAGLGLGLDAGGGAPAGLKIGEGC